MNITIIRRIRLGLAIATAGLAGSLLLGTGVLGAEEPCEFGGPGEWTCAQGPHLYAGHCEGIDCYSAMEFCCVTME